MIPNLIRVFTSILSWFYHREAKSITNTNIIINGSLLPILYWFFQFKSIRTLLFFKYQVVISEARLRTNVPLHFIWTWVFTHIYTTIQIISQNILQSLCVQFVFYLIWACYLNFAFVVHVFALCWVLHDLSFYARHLTSCCWNFCLGLVHFRSLDLSS